MVPNFWTLTYWLLYKRLTIELQWTCFFGFSGATRQPAVIGAVNTFWLCTLPSLQVHVQQVAPGLGHLRSSSLLVGGHDLAGFFSHVTPTNFFLSGNLVMFQNAKTCKSRVTIALTHTWTRVLRRDISKNRGWNPNNKSSNWHSLAQHPYQLKKYYHVANLWLLGLISELGNYAWVHFYRCHSCISQNNSVWYKPLGNDSEVRQTPFSCIQLYT